MCRVTDYKLFEGGKFPALYTHLTTYGTDSYNIFTQ